MLNLNGPRLVLIAASGRAAAEAYAERNGTNPTLILTKDDLIQRPRGLREMVRRAAGEVAILHSTDWSRQRNPQFYELSLAVLPVRERYLADERLRTFRRLSHGALAGRIALTPAQALRGAVFVAAEGARLSLRRVSVRRGLTVTGGVAGRRSILAIWHGGADFGGSVTHISGILNGFRRCGFHVGLLCCWPPPAQVRSAVDEIEVIPPLSSAARITVDLEHIASNEPLRRAGVAFAHRLRPMFVYQRHSPFLRAGADVARTIGAPFVLEWNSSQVWVGRNWQHQFLVERLLNPLLVASEREIVRRATLLVAVSREAGDMARGAGAQPARMLVVPNAVDFDEVSSVVRFEHPAQGHSGPVLGFAGSFGPWHGAEVAVRALARLPEEIRLLMIGDGQRRASSAALAESLGVAERVVWTGAIPRTEALKRLAQCDILLSPQTPLAEQPFFGSPTKIFEYMAIGKPIVASRLGQIGEVLEDGVTARLVEPGDVRDLADTILAVLSLPDRGRGLGDAARRAVAAEHTWDHRGRAILERLGAAAPTLDEFAVVS